MTSSTEFPTHSIDNILSLDDIVRNYLTMFGLRSDRLVDLNTLQLLAAPYVSNASPIELPKDYQSQWRLAVELGQDMVELTSERTGSEQPRKTRQGYSKEKQQYLAGIRQRFLEQALLVFTTLEDTANKILAEAGFTSNENKGPRPTELAERVLHQFPKTVRHFENALKHNQTLMSE